MGAEFVHGLFGSCPWRQAITAVIPIDCIWRVKTRMFASSIIAVTYTPPATRHHPFHTLKQKWQPFTEQSVTSILPSLACRPIRLVSFHRRPEHPLLYPVYPKLRNIRHRPIANPPVVERVSVVGLVEGPRSDEP